MSVIQIPLLVFQILLQADHPYCPICEFKSSDWDLIHAHILLNHPEFSVKKEVTINCKRYT